MSKEKRKAKKKKLKKVKSKLKENVKTKEINGWKLGDKFGYEKSVYKIKEFGGTAFGVKTKGKGLENVQIALYTLKPVKKKRKKKKK